MNTIHISLNELENAAYKALESLKYDEGFCEALSKDVVFLEAAGLKGVSQFVTFLLSYQNMCEQDTHFVITPCSDKEEEPTYVFDGHHMSCIYFIEPCVEYIVSLVKKSSHFTVLFQNSYDYVFLVPYLQKFSPIPISIQWYDEKKKKCTIGFMFPENQYPEFFSNTPENVNAHMNDTLVTYASAEHYKSVQRQCTSMRFHLGAEECANYFQKSVAEGVFIDHNEWNVIQTFEKAVLVPSNNVSRSGAGEIENAIDSEDVLFKKI